ncbi:hypothetical protein OTU49_013893 [Cherax quadricarinatus]
MGKQKKEESKKRPPSDSSESDSDSGPDDKKEPPAKMTKSDASSSSSRRKNDSGETYFELDRNKRVTVREFKGRLFVDIREFYEKDGKTLPGKKGISLTTSMWNKLKSLQEEVDEEIQQLS